MTPGARVAAAIELLAESERSPSPADVTVTAYFRKRRYAGAKDRRAISQHVYDLWRRRARLGWWAARAGLDPSAARHRVLADLVLARGRTADEVAALFDGAGHAPKPLSHLERNALDALPAGGLDDPAMPERVAFEYPDWLDEPLKRAFGADLAAEMTALNVPAPLDLRVNGLKADCRRAIRLLAGDGIDAEPTPHAPLGLRVEGRTDISQSTAFKGGFVEVQDEGSQLAALMTAARPGMRVVDYCAGAGGKTLALAADMGNDGEIVACDADAGRLARMTPRLKRAGVTIAAPCPLASGAPPGGADRVLVDAPCSGSGRWRRAVDARWRLTAEDLAALTETQDAILADAAELVKPGGRLVYVTCSVLAEENEDRVAAFLGGRPAFGPLPAAEVWRDVLGTAPPPGCGEFLRLTPAKHATDGFFVAILENHD